MKEQVSAKKTLKACGNAIREIAAIAIWIIIFTEIFVTDLGDLITKNYPLLDTALHYRLLIILALAAISWLFLGNKIFFRFFVYIIAYPLVLTLWIIPKIIFKNWVLVIAFSPAIYQFIRAFKTNFLISVLLISISFLVCQIKNNPIAITLGISIIALYLCHHFINRFKAAYSSSTIFTVLKNSVSEIQDKAQDNIEKTKPQGNPDSDDYKKKLVQNLLTSYVFNTILHFSVAKLKEVIESRKMDLYFLCSLIWTFIVATLSFSIIYYGLFRISPSNFSGASDSSFVDFIGFSFGTLMTASISSIIPASGLAQLVTYIQLFASLLLIVLLVFVILTSIREKYKKDLDDLLFGLADAERKSKLLIEQNYEITMETLERMLVQDNEQIMKFILNIRYGKAEADIIMKKLKEDIDSSDSSELTVIQSTTVEPN
jgi:hypothetical protein